MTTPGVDVLEAAAVLALDREWEDAIVARDISALERLASDDLVYSHASCEIDDKATFVEHTAHGPLRFHQVEYEDVAVVVRAFVALFTCALHLRISDCAGEPGELHFRTTHVWAYERSGWRLVANHSTHLPTGHPLRRMPDAAVPADEPDGERGHGC